MANSLEIGRNVNLEVERQENEATAAYAKTARRNVLVKPPVPVPIEEFLGSIEEELGRARMAVDGHDPDEPTPKPALFALRSIAALAIRAMMRHGVVAGRPPATKPSES